MWPLFVLAAADTCLLTLRASTRTIPTSPRLLQLVQWTQQHGESKDALLRSIPVNHASMDAFIKEQESSTDACHAKMIETRRTLDGLEAQVIGLSDQYESHHKLEVANTQVLEENTEKARLAAKTREEEEQACADEPADPQISQLVTELIEMRQIAEPSVRSSIAQDVNYEEEAKKYAANVSKKVAANVSALQLESDLGLLQFNHEQCRQFVGFLQRSTRGNYSELDCNQTRAHLQNEFTTAYVEITRLLEAAKKGDQQDLAECLALAKAKHDRAMAAIDEAIAEASRNILLAKAQMTALDSLLQDAKDVLKKVQEHLKSLKEDCSTSGDVSEHLQKIRNLIEALDACPGRNDFDLELPAT